MESLSELIETGQAQARHPGQVRSGDRVVICPHGNGLLLSVIDGLGHGPEAAAAADAAVAELVVDAQRSSIIGLVQRCHEALRGTRGAVIGLASISLEDDTVTWLGVGNTMGMLVRSNPEEEMRNESLLQRAGLVGHKLPPLRAEIIGLSPGDLIVLATDGIGPNFRSSIHSGAAPQIVADTILAEHFKGTDDAAVVVARFSGTRGANWNSRQ